MAASKKKTTKRKNASGAGRPIEGKSAKNTGIFVRIEKTQRAAIEKYLVKLNASRVKKGLPKIKLSSWLREVGLKHSGNEELGAAAKARRAASVDESL